MNEPNTTSNESAEDQPPPPNVEEDIDDMNRTKADAPTQRLEAEEEGVVAALEDEILAKGGPHPSLIERNSSGAARPPSGAVNFEGEVEEHRDATERLDDAKHTILTATETEGSSIHGRSSLSSSAGRSEPSEEDRKEAARVDPISQHAQSHARLEDQKAAALAGTAAAVDGGSSSGKAGDSAHASAEGGSSTTTPPSQTTPDPTTRLSREVSRPGAFPQAGPGGPREDDNTIIIGDDETTPEPPELDRNQTHGVSIPGFRVDEDSTADVEQGRRRRNRPELVEATHVTDDAWRKWKIIFGTILAAAVIAGVVVVVLVVRNRRESDSGDDGGEPPTPVPTTMVPTASPTEPSFTTAWEQVGFNITGELPNDFMGFTSTVSRNGRVVASFGYPVFYPANPRPLRVYDIVGDQLEQKGNVILDSYAFPIPFTDDLQTVFETFNVALSGDGSVLAVVGYALVRVYEYDSDLNDWLQRGEDIMVPTDAELGTFTSLSDDGTVLALGGVQSRTTEQGWVRVFQYTGGSWSPLGQELVGPAEGARFGYQVSLSSNGTVVAVGAPELTTERGVSTGQVEIYHLVGDQWAPLGNTPILGGGELDRLGLSIVLTADGQCLAAGAVSVEGTRPGFVFVYCLSPNGIWERRGNILAGTGPEDRFGTMVGLSSDGLVLAVAAIQNDSGADNAGQVLVFDYREDIDFWVPSWEILGTGELNFFGFSMAMSDDGNVLIAGALRNSDVAPSAGHARVFRKLKCLEPVDDFAEPVCTPF